MIAKLWRVKGEERKLISIFEVEEVTNSYENDIINFRKKGDDFSYTLEDTDMLEVEDVSFRHGAPNVEISKRAKKKAEAKKKRQEDKEAKLSATDVDNEVLKAWKKYKDLPTAKFLTAKRKESIKYAFERGMSVEDLDEVFYMASISPWFVDKGKERWADMSWVIDKAEEFLEGGQYYRHKDGKKEEVKPVREIDASKIVII